MSEGQGGGEFYTPASIVQLLAQVIEPFHGRNLDPACGSGGMFVQSARFVAKHHKNPAAELSICGVEKTNETGRLARLNLAVHGLEGDIRHGGNVNSYYEVTLNVMQVYMRGFKSEKSVLHGTKALSWSCKRTAIPAVVSTFHPKALNR